MRYDREMMATTIKAMKRVEEVRSKREEIFAKNRMQPRKDAERNLALSQLQKNVALAAAPVGKKTEKVKVAKTEASRKMEID